jgi:hypothetical protein
MHTAQFNKRNVLCEMSATCVTVGMVSTLSTPLLFIGILTASMQKDAPSANGCPNTIILQGQWESAIVKDESTWTLDDGKLVLDIRKRVEGEWKVPPCSSLHPPAFLFLADSHSQRHQWRRFSHRPAQSCHPWCCCRAEPGPCTCAAVLRALCSRGVLACHAQARGAVRTPTSTHHLLPFVLGDAGACHDDAERDVGHQAADMHDCSCFVSSLTLTSGIHLIARIHSPTSQRMSKRAFHMLKWAPSKHGTGVGFGLQKQAPDVSYSLFYDYFPPFLQRCAVHFSTRI